MIIPKRYSTVVVCADCSWYCICHFALYSHMAQVMSEHERARFLGSLLQNSVYFLLVVNAAMFFICATTLAWGGLATKFPKGIGSNCFSLCPVIGVICGVILLAIVFGNNHAIYHWAATEKIKLDDILIYKSGFLNKRFFAVWTSIDQLRFGHYLVKR